MPIDEDDLAVLARARRSGLSRDLLGFLAENKKWWLAPILLAVILLGVLVLASGTGAAPFIYTLF